MGNIIGAKPEKLFVQFARSRCKCLLSTDSLMSLYCVERGCEKLEKTAVKSDNNFFFDFLGAFNWQLNVVLLCRIWTRRGTQGNKWRYAQVNLISNQPFYVIFEGVRGSSYMGDIALDDLDVADGPCPPPKACDFETDMCLWKNTVGDNFNWQRDSGGTPSLGTGPSSDHTTGTSNGGFGSFLCLFWYLSD